MQNSRSNQPTSEADFYELRQEGKTYVSECFRFREGQPQMRNIHIVYNNSNSCTVGEINGAMALRISPKMKNQICALVTQDDKKIKRLTLQSFTKRPNGDLKASEENTFTFHDDEFKKLLAFLNSVQFINLEDLKRFQIKDMSNSSGDKVIIDNPQAELMRLLKNSTGDGRLELLKQISGNLNKSDIEILLGRKEQLEVFGNELKNNLWDEKRWQDFFESHKWIFGYGLDYKITKPFDREMNVTSTGTDNREKAIVDYLMTFTDFTVIVEIKKPDARIFTDKKGRSGTWEFDKNFINAISQILEQKAEWTIMGATKSELYNKKGDKTLSERTRDPKAILVYGSRSEFSVIQNERDKNIMRDTFELFRRDSRNLEIITYDELYERAKFIVQNE